MDMRRRKDKTMSGKEHKLTPENVKGKVTESVVSPSEPDTSLLHCQAEIRKLQEEITKLQQELRSCRTTCSCHGKKGNMSELNQRELHCHVSKEADDASKEAGHTSKETGTRKKEYQSNHSMNKGKNSNHSMNKGKNSKEHQTKYDSFNADLCKMDLDHHGNASSEAGACKMEYPTMQFRNKQTRKENQTKCGPTIADLSEMECYDHGHASNEAGTTRKGRRMDQYMNTGYTRRNQIKNETHYADSNEIDIANSELASFDAGACSKEHQNMRTKHAIVGSKSADQQDIANTVDDWEKHLAHQGLRNEDSSQEVSFSNREGNIPTRLKGNVTNVHERGTRDSYGDKFHDKKKGIGSSWYKQAAIEDFALKDDRGRDIKEREENKRKREKHEERQISEINGDLFAAPDDFSLAHCVAADLCMGSGIAVTFKQKFRRVDELMGQRKRVGDVAVLEEGRRYIYYLITKKHSTGKPRLLDLEKSLYQMKQHIVANGVRKLAIPRIGCGLDRLNWKDVRQMLEEVFNDIDIKFTVYNFTVGFNNNSSDSIPSLADEAREKKTKIPKTKKRNGKRK